MLVCLRGVVCLIIVRGRGKREKGCFGVVIVEKQKIKPT